MRCAFWKSVLAAYGLTSLPGEIFGKSEWRLTGCAFATVGKVSRSISVIASVPHLVQNGYLTCRTGAAGGLHMELKNNWGPKGTLSSS